MPDDGFRLGPDTRPLSRAASPVTRLGRTALILGLAWVAGDGLPAPSAGAAVQVHDTTADTMDVGVDSSAAHAATLDSLRERTAELRAVITRLRVRYRARVQRIESGLRFRLPYPTAEHLSAGGEGEAPPVARIADLAKRYYPSAAVTVLGTVDGARPSCGSGTERRRAQAVVERLRESGAIDPDRVRRAECDRAALTDSGQQVPRGRPDSATGVTVYIEWDTPPGSP